MKQSILKTSSFPSPYVNSANLHEGGLCPPPSGVNILDIDVPILDFLVSI